MTLQQAFDFAPRKPDAARRNLVIEAGAGTGKTTAIVAEVLKLMLEREELAPERIVLVTFTEKAAGEIADRVREALEELAEQALGVGREAFGPRRSPDSSGTTESPERSTPNASWPAN